MFTDSWNQDHNGTLSASFALTSYTNHILFAQNKYDMTKYTSKAVWTFSSAVVAQLIRPQNLNREVPGSNLLAAAVVPLGKALYRHCLVPQKGLKSCWTPGCLLS